MSGLGAPAALAAELAERYPLPADARRILDAWGAPPETLTGVLLDLPEGLPILQHLSLSTGITVGPEETWTADLIERIGTPQVRAAALVASMTAIGEGRATTHIDWLEFLRIAVGTGIAATFALPEPHRQAGDSFAVGLCHDMGLLLLDLHAPNEIGALMDDVDWRLRTPAQERERLGFALHELTAHVLYRWGFPLPMVIAVLELDGPDRSPLGEALWTGQQCARVLGVLRGDSTVSEPSREVFVLALTQFLENYRSRVDQALVGTLAPATHPGVSKSSQARGDSDPAEG